VPVIAHEQGADPGAIVFDAMQAAHARGVDVLISTLPDGCIEAQPDGGVTKLGDHAEDGAGSSAGTISLSTHDWPEWLVQAKHFLMRSRSRHPHRQAGRHRQGRYRFSVAMIGHAHFYVVPEKMHRLLSSARIRMWTSAVSW
jgi:hypothetical protein